MTAITIFICLSPEGLNKEVAARVVRHYYPLHFEQASPAIESLGMAGGFSGARFWRVTDRNGQIWCLRRWPDSKAAEPGRLGWIHQQVRTIYQSGFHAVPVPVASREGSSLVEFQGFRWQLEPWMPGSANFHTAPSLEKLKSAMQALGQIHHALAQAHPRLDRSVGLNDRWNRIRYWLNPADRSFSNQFLELESRLRSGPPMSADPAMSAVFEAGSVICMRFRRMCHAIADELNQAKDLRVEIQPVIADIWHDHVLFQGDLVSGVIDFGAMRLDATDCDVARLLGSLVRDDAALRQAGLTAYATCSNRPPGFALVGLFDRSTVLLSGMNWLDWIVIEGRHFDGLPKIVDRLREICGRLENLAGTL